MNDPKKYAVLEDIGDKTMEALRGVKEQCTTAFEVDTFARVAVYAGVQMLSLQSGNEAVQEYLAEIAKLYPIDDQTH